MKTTSTYNWWAAMFMAVVFAAVLYPDHGRAVTTVFFDSSQTANLVSTNNTSDTIRSEGYVFTYTRDKLFTGGVGLTNPIGRSVRIPWPDGLEAQAVTAGPAPGNARIDISREDGQVFAIQSFTAKLLANTFGAGADIEVMPLLDGEDGFPNPLKCPASGYYGQNFTYNTPTLIGFDAYKITLYVDFALMSLTVVDASLPPPLLEILQMDSASVQLSWSTNAVGYALESVTNLVEQAWNPVTNSVTTNGDLFTVRLPITGSRQFYRLRK